MKFRLIDTKDSNLDSYKVKASDREYQFWERNPLSIDLWSRSVFIQKLKYMHNNPVQLCNHIVNYVHFQKNTSTPLFGSMNTEI